MLSRTCTDWYDTKIVYQGCRPAVQLLLYPSYGFFMFPLVSLYIQHCTREVHRTAVILYLLRAL